MSLCFLSSRSWHRSRIFLQEPKTTGSSRLRILSPVKMYQFYFFQFVVGSSQDPDLFFTGQIKINRKILKPTAQVRDAAAAYGTARPLLRYGNRREEVPGIKKREIIRIGKCKPFLFRRGRKKTQNEDLNIIYKNNVNKK